MEQFEGLIQNRAYSIAGNDTAKLELHYQKIRHKYAKMIDLHVQGDPFYNGDESSDNSDHDSNAIFDTNETINKNEKTVTDNRPKIKSIEIIKPAQKLPEQKVCLTFHLFFPCIRDSRLARHTE